MASSNCAWGKSKPLLVVGRDGKLKNVNPNIFKYCPVNLLDILSYQSASDYGWLRNLVNIKTLDKPSFKKVAIMILAEINKLALEHHANLVFVMSPLKGDLKTVNESNVFFEDILKNQGYRYVDFAKKMLDDKLDINALYLRKEDCHYSPYGNFQLAKTIRALLDF